MYEIPGENAAVRSVSREERFMQYVGGCQWLKVIRCRVGSPWQARKEDRESVYEIPGANTAVKGV